MDDYWLSDDERTWSGARSACEARGSFLAIVHSAADNAEVTALVSGVGDAVWLGGSDSAAEGTWRWVDGSRVHYDGWAGGEPNDYDSGEDCLATQASGRWNDLPCGDSLRYVCGGFSCPSR